MHNNKSQKKPHKCGIKIALKIVKDRKCWETTLRIPMRVLVGELQLINSYCDSSI